MAAIHTDTSSAQVQVTREFHLNKQFLCESTHLSNQYSISINLIHFRTSIIVELFTIRVRSGTLFSFSRDCR